MNEETIYWDLSAENLSENLFGVDNKNRASHINLKMYKEKLLKFSATLEKVIENNVFGDDSHRDHLVEECKLLRNKIEQGEYLDKTQHETIIQLYIILFNLMGDMPINRSKGVNYKKLHEQTFQEHRTFFYCRSNTQKVRKILDLAYSGILEGISTELTHACLIDKFNEDFKKRAKEFLDWFRESHPKAWEMYIR